MASTSSVNTKQYRFGLTLVSSLVAGCISLYLGSLASTLDLELRQTLASTFGTQTAAQANTAFGLGGAGVLLIAFGSCLIGTRLAFGPRLICWLQLFIVSILLQWFALYSNVPMSATAFFLAILSGGSAGYLQRLFWQRETKHQAQYYELVLRNRELQEARLQMVKQDEVDRRLLAADLHDQVLNDLKAIGQKVSILKANPREDTGKEIDLLLQQTMTGIREVMDSLSPAVLEHLGLPASIEDCLRRASERSGFKVRFKNSIAENDLAAVGQIEQILLYRLVQECCTNISKHAQANRVKATMEKEGEQLVIAISDDGQGIDPSVRLMESRGLRYMRQRADLIGANIAWLPGDEGKGTKVEIRLPVAHENDAAKPQQTA
jgi:signal transduction histidine kinase